MVAGLAVSADYYEDQIELLNSSNYVIIPKQKIK